MKVWNLPPSFFFFNLWGKGRRGFFMGLGAFGAAFPLPPAPFPRRLWAVYLHSLVAWCSLPPHLPLWLHHPPQSACWVYGLPSTLSSHSHAMTINFFWFCTVLLGSVPFWHWFNCEDICLNCCSNCLIATCDSIFWFIPDMFAFISKSRPMHQLSLVICLTSPQFLNFQLHYHDFRVECRFHSFHSDNYIFLPNYYLCLRPCFYHSILPDCCFHDIYCLCWSSDLDSLDFGANDLD